MDWVVANFALIVFFIFAGAAVAGAIGVILARSPVHAAISLLGTFLAIAALFILQRAEFLAVVQILVYAGGVMVLFLFVIMLVNVRTLPDEPQFVKKMAPAAVVVGLILAGVVAAGIVRSFPAVSGDPGALVSISGEVVGNTEAVGWELYLRYLLPFEVVSVVLLVAMIGAIVMGRKESSDGRNA